MPHRGLNDVGRGRAANAYGRPTYAWRTRRGKYPEPIKHAVWEPLGAARCHLEGDDIPGTRPPRQPALIRQT